MALVSPGIQISINDQSQYVNSNVGSTALVILATAQDKTYNGSPATGTSKANAGKLLAFTSQRDLVTQMGTPTFQVSSSGTPVNGSEINEYGLMTAYSALGLSNLMYAIRADIDLNELKGTSVRPVGDAADGTLWLNTSTTDWGIESWNQTTNTWTTVTPSIVTDSSKVENVAVLDNPSVPTPISSYGQISDYALVFTDPDGAAPERIRLFYKRGTNTYQGYLLNDADVSSVYVDANQWVEVGSPHWQTAVRAATGSVANPSITASSTLTINTITVTSDNTNLTISGTNGLADKINNAGIPGVYAAVTTLGQLALFATSSAASNGSTVDGKMVVTDGTYTPLANCGIANDTYYSPYFFYGSYAQEPASGWSVRPTKSTWWKTSQIGGGWKPQLKQYNTALAAFSSLSVNMYSDVPAGIYALDPVGGGSGIADGEILAIYEPSDSTYNSLKFVKKLPGSETSITSGTPNAFTIGNTFIVYASQPGSSAMTSRVVTLSGTTATAFVTGIQSANIPYLAASVNSDGTITLTHTKGGIITLENTTVGGDPIADANFVLNDVTGSYQSADGLVHISNFGQITADIEYQDNAPFQGPDTGTYWYYSNPAEVDIMINNYGWKGYRNLGPTAKDIRGYTLYNTDPNGVIVTPAPAPTSQSDGTSLAAGDLWLDSGDLENYPSLYRYSGTKWVAIDNTDHVSSNGIVFADARWAGNGTTDVVSGDVPSTADLLSSNYIDLDAPDYRLYPRGTLLFNTRRSGYNVKRFVADYFNDTNFPDVGANSLGYPTALPTVKDCWVSASGLDANEVMYSGSRAQRNLVVGAMQAAIDSNLDVLSPMFQFNLMVAPNYPELIDNMLALNDNRGDTAFVIGDTPLNLAPNAVTIANWINNTDGATGFVIPSSPYAALYYPAGQTNDLAGNTIVVPASHAVLRTYLYNDQVSYPWFPPAGLNRGSVNNLSDIGYLNADGGWVHNAIENGLRDALFTLKINPLTQLPASGIAVWGQLTRSAITSARDRVNVVRLENYLRTIFQSIANGYLFEPNDSITRKSIAAAIAGSLNTILAHRGLYDFLVVCDESNNTTDTIANSQLWVDVAIEPMRGVEFIYIPIGIYNPGQIKALGV